MHKQLPNFFIFLDQFNNIIYKNNNTNLGIVYRNYSSKKRDVELIKIAKACKKSKIKLYVSNNIKLALKVKADGLYIPSFNKTKRFAHLEKKITIIGSAHNQREINEKVMQNCSAIFLSPIFYAKKKKEFHNIIKFNILSRKNKVDFFALGGITENNISKLKLLNIKGFGGITLFKKKPAFKRPVFLKNCFF